MKAPLFRSAVCIALLMGSAIVPSTARADDHAVILLYHHVASDTPSSTSVDPATFEAHLDYLARHHFHVWSLTTLLTRLEAGESVPEHTVALTFDDAYASVFSEAYPRLKRHGWPFTVFVSTDYIDKDYKGYMTWDQLREVAAHGAELGNHSRSHPHLVRRNDDEGEARWRDRVRSEITGAQQRLAAETHNPVKVFAYPYGEFSPSLEEIVAQLGFYAVGQQSGAVGVGSDLHAAPRFPMAAGYAEQREFITKVNTRPLPVTVLAPRDPVLGGAPVRPVLRMRLGAGAYRLDGLACYASGQGAMTLNWVDRQQRIVEIRPRAPLKTGGRYKYNCTAPAIEESGVYFWYSHLWMKKNPDGTWYSE
jgi:biofilm PGA synthesis lipoprotein PgaB